MEYIYLCTSMFKINRTRRFKGYFFITSELIPRGDSCIICVTRVIVDRSPVESRLPPLNFISWNYVFGSRIKIDESLPVMAGTLSRKRYCLNFFRDTGTRIEWPRIRGSEKIHLPSVHLSHYR